MSEPEFSLAQAMAAQGALRDAIGLPEERFPLAAFVGMISDEIDQARAAGKDDDAIARLLSQASGHALTPAALQRHYAPPEARRRG